MARQYRKRPVVIEAIQFDGSNAEEIKEWSGGAVEAGVGPYQGRASDILRIHTTEGMMVAGPGEWIIKGTAGEFYPCKPDVFADVYEEV